MTAEEIRKRIEPFIQAGADPEQVASANAGAVIMASWMLSEIAAQLAELNETLRTYDLRGGIARGGKA